MFNHERHELHENFAAKRHKTFGTDFTDSHKLKACKADKYYRYRDEAVQEHVLAWAEANQVTVEDDTKKRKS